MLFNQKVTRRNCLDFKLTLKDFPDEGKLAQNVTESWRSKSPDLNTRAYKIIARKNTIFLLEIREVTIHMYFLLICSKKDMASKRITITTFHRNKKEAISKSTSPSACSILNT